MIGFPLISYHVTIQPSIHLDLIRSPSNLNYLMIVKAGIFSEFGIFRHVGMFKRLGSLNDPLKVLTVVDGVQRNYVGHCSLRRN